MKLKTDFVTNSSSTSYMFIFKGKSIEDLFKIMKNNWSDFEINNSYDEIEINVYDVIYYMRNENPEIITIKEKISILENEIKEELRRIEKYKGDKEKEHIIDYLNKEIQTKERTIEFLKFKSKNKFDLIVECGFSDEDEDKTGITVRSSSISIDKPNLKVMCGVD